VTLVFHVKPLPPTTEADKVNNEFIQTEGDAGVMVIVGEFNPTIFALVALVVQPFAAVPIRV
jgi:hypothetical protein